MWAVDEMDLPHERIDFGGKYGGLDDPGFLAMNPNALIPVIDDGGTVVWESNAIIRYLAAKDGGGILCGAEPGERARADQWMDWMQTKLNPPFIGVFVGLIRTPAGERDLPAIEAATARLNDCYRFLDRQLASRPYLAGDDFSMADIPAGATLYRYYDMEIERPELKHLRDWYERLRDRPAYPAHVMISYDDLRG
jgi:glutathione S-transferase